MKKNLDLELNPSVISSLEHIKDVNTQVLQRAKNILLYIYTNSAIKEELDANYTYYEEALEDTFLICRIFEDLQNNLIKKPE